MKNNCDNLLRLYIDIIGASNEECQRMTNKNSSTEVEDGVVRTVLEVV